MENRVNWMMTYVENFVVAIGQANKVNMVNLMLIQDDLFAKGMPHGQLKYCDDFSS